jgi:hypothetical protein
MVPVILIIRIPETSFIRILGPDAADERESFLVAEAQSGAVLTGVPGIQVLGEADQLLRLALDESDVGVVEVEVVVDVPDLPYRDIEVVVKKDGKEQYVPCWPLLALCSNSEDTDHAVLPMMCSSTSQAVMSSFRSGSP